MTMDPEGPAEKTNGTFWRKGVINWPFEVPEGLCTRIGSIQIQSKGKQGVVETSLAEIGISIEGLTLQEGEV